MPNMPPPKSKATSSRDSTLNSSRFSLETVTEFRDESSYMDASSMQGILYCLYYKIEKSVDYEHGGYGSGCK